MLPPVDEQILRDHPDFAKLYKTLTTTILNPDGSTRNSKEYKEFEATQNETNHARLKMAKQHLLERAIATALPNDQARNQSSNGSRSQFGNKRPPPTNEPSEAVVDLLHILPPLLDASNTISAEDTALLLSSKPLCDLESLLPELARLLSSNLHSSALSLARITHTSTPPSSLHRHIPSLENDLALLKEDLSSARGRLFEARICASAALSTLLRSHVEVLSLLVRCVETKHGPVARSLELRAQEVTLQAQRADSDAGRNLATLQQEMFSPEAVSALTNYGTHLRDAKVRGAERVRNLQRELEDYGVGGDGEKETLMREMVKAHEEMGRQIDEVTIDLARLQTK